MATFLLLLQYVFGQYFVLQIVFLSVMKLILEYNFRVLFAPLCLISDCVAFWF